MVEEYGAEEDTHNERVYTCLIASEAGQVSQETIINLPMRVYPTCLGFELLYMAELLQQFTIYWETLTRVDHHTKISADGIQVTHKVVISSIKIQVRSLGVLLNEHEIRPYVFSDIKLTGEIFSQYLALNKRNRQTTYLTIFQTQMMSLPLQSPRMLPKLAV